MCVYLLSAGWFVALIVSHEPQTCAFALSGSSRSTEAELKSLAVVLSLRYSQLDVRVTRPNYVTMSYADAFFKRYREEEAKER